MENHTCADGANQVPLPRCGHLLLACGEGLPIQSLSGGAARILGSAAGPGVRFTRFLQSDDQLHLLTAAKQLLLPPGQKTTMEAEFTGFLITGSGCRHFLFYLCVVGEHTLQLFLADMEPEQWALLQLEKLRLTHSQQEKILLARAERDGLTGLYNKTSFEERAAQQLGRCQGAALFLMDMDRFKQVNDRCGHPCGDQVLREGAAAIRGCMRRADFAGRIGGDEFAAFLPGLQSRADAREKAAHLLAALAQVQLPDRALTAAVGVAIARPQEGYPSLYDRADAALYAAKREGCGGIALAPAGQVWYNLPHTEPPEGSAPATDK